MARTFCLDQEAVVEVLDISHKKYGLLIIDLHLNDLELIHLPRLDIKDVLVLQKHPYQKDEPFLLIHQYIKDVLLHPSHQYHVLVTEIHQYRLLHHEVDTELEDLNPIHPRVIVMVAVIHRPLRCVNISINISIRMRFHSLYSDFINLSWYVVIKLCVVNN